MGCTLGWQFPRIIRRVNGGMVVLVYICKIGVGESIDSESKKRKESEVFVDYYYSAVLTNVKKLERTSIQHGKNCQ